MAYAPRGIQSFLKAIPLWIKQKLWIKDYICEQLGFKGKVIFPEHHESHAASAFFPSPFREAAILTLDGVGEWATSSLGIGKDNHIELLSEIYFPHSLGLLYAAFTYYTGFRVNSGEYKVMGLAPYGQPRYKDLILSELVDLKENGSFKLNMKYFDFGAGLRMVNRRFEKLFGGPARKPESRLTQRDMDLARSIQEVTEEIMLRMARYAHQITGLKNLCLAGGVALNCVGNGRILREGPFENLWIQPAAGDAGGALGAAYLGWYQYLEKPRERKEKTDSMRGSFLGPEFKDEEIESFLKKQDVPYTKLDEKAVVEIVADLIADEKVIGWFQGSMEFGPRALGGRSILGDARSPKMQEVMNLKIKFRESFRPFAPAVLRERVSDYFELNCDSHYMLLVAPVKKDLQIGLSENDQKKEGLELLYVRRSNIPAVTHVDYSARIQTVTETENPMLYRLLSQFDQKHHSAVVINTSFNVRGEPIVCTPQDAYRCFMRTNMDYLVLGRYLLAKEAQKPLEKDTSWQKEYALD